MNTAYGLEFGSMVGQVMLFDLLLSGDNAVVIALAAQGLSAPMRRRAVLFGTGLAVLLRTVLSLVAIELLRWPWIKLVAGLLLVGIALKLSAHEGRQRAHRPAQTRLWAAVVTMVGADLALSLDNVLALAASSRGSFGVLLAGLALSVPILMFGSLWLDHMFRRLPWLLPAGAALLGWIAGSTALGDPLLAPWVDRQGTLVQIGVPLLTASIVLLRGPVVARFKRGTRPGGR